MSHRNKVLTVAAIVVGFVIVGLGAVKSGPPETCSDAASCEKLGIEMRIAALEKWQRDERAKRRAPPSPKPVAGWSQEAERDAARPTRSVRCGVPDFDVEGFRVAIVDDCRDASCPVLNITGRLKNNCSIAAGARIVIIAADDNGNVVDVVEGWPARTKNIAPGNAYAFNLGYLMSYKREMKGFHVNVIDARTWQP